MSTDEVARWQYRCEGNRNIVVAAADNEKRVIRRLLKLAPVKGVAHQPKACKPELSNGAAAVAGDNAVRAAEEATPETAEATEQAAAAAAAAADQQKAAEEVYAIARYYANVMKPLLQCYLVVPAPVAVGPQFVERVLLACASFRPDERKKSPVHGAAVCLELPDLCYLPHSDSGGGSRDERPTFAVEVKLKSGVCSLRAPGGGRVACLPCAQYKQLKMDGIVTGCHASDQPYCPVDLFSGNRKRMMFALRTSLQDGRLGTNRLRVFKDGAYLSFAGQEKWSPERYQAALEEQLAPFFSSAAGTRCETLLHLVVDALLTPNGDGADADGSVTTAAQSVGARGDKCKLSLFPSEAAAATGVNGEGSASCWDGCEAHDAGGSSSLPGGCLLDRVLAAQMLCSDSVEVVYRDCFLPLVDYLDDNPAVAKRLFSYELPYWDVRAKKSQLLDVGCCEETVIGHFLQVRNFLISKTASDCSAMITLKPIGLEDGLLLTKTDGQVNAGGRVTVLTDSTGMAYRWSIHVIDLDPKPLHKLPVYMDTYRRCMKALSVEAT